MATAEKSRSDTPGKRKRGSRGIAKEILAPGSESGAGPTSVAASFNSTKRWLPIFGFDTPVACAYIAYGDADHRITTGSHNDWEAIRYRRPPTWRSNIFIHSSSHTRKPLASETSA